MTRTLTAEDVHLIRTSALRTGPLSAQLGVHPTTIRRARSGSKWAAHPTAPARGPRSGWKKLQPPAPFNPETFSLPGEEWRPALGWERYYRVSSLGRVYSLHQSGRLATGMEVHARERRERDAA